MDGNTQGWSGPRVKQELIDSRFVRNAWYVAAWAQELEAGKLLSRTILGEPVVIYRADDGSPAALEDRCPHRFAPLSMGKVIKGDKVQCPYHGLELDSSGACTHNPHGAKNIPSRAKVTSYTLVEKHQALWIWMGDAALADPGRIPDFTVLDAVPEYCSTKLDKIEVAADYKLIIDNLLELSHTCYLQAGTLGNADTIDSSIDVEMDGDDIIVSRLATDAAAPGMMSMMWPGHPGKVDVFTRMRWMAPTTMKLFTGICEMGRPWESGTGIHALHLLTPETEHSTHYFFTAVRFGLKINDPVQNREIQEKIGKMRRYAFTVEDAPVIEAQQRIIDQANRTLDPVILSVDAGTVRFRRAIDRLVAAEA
ncbi:MAG: Rieske 2Fe-2S domain-containing protein [Hyphomicrobiaceae bacterium]